MSDWNSLPVEKAEAFETKKGLMTGKKSKALPTHIAEKVTSGETFSVSGLSDGKDAKAFIYAVRVAAKAVEGFNEEGVNVGHGLKVQVDEPNILLKDLTLDTPGPITLRMSTATILDTRRGRGGDKATPVVLAAAEGTTGVVPEPKTESEKIVDGDIDDYDPTGDEFSVLDQLLDSEAAGF